VTCGNQAGQWSQIHGTTGLAEEDYVPRCVSCHSWYDNGGERNGNAKLTEAGVRNIRARYAVSGTYGALTAMALEYGVNLSTISGVVHRKSWKGVV
jgi:hypothetical protein